MPCFMGKGPRYCGSSPAEAALAGGGLESWGSEVGPSSPRLRTLPLQARGGPEWAGSAKGLLPAARRLGPTNRVVRTVNLTEAWKQDLAARDERASSPLSGVSLGGVTH